MLCISRKAGQRVRIGPDIWVTVIQIDRDKVRFGIDAPREVRIDRNELLPDADQRPDLTPRPEGV